MGDVYLRRSFITDEVTSGCWYFSAKFTFGWAKESSTLLGRGGSMEYSVNVIQGLNKKVTVWVADGFGVTAWVTAHESAMGQQGGVFSRVIKER